MTALGFIFKELQLHLKFHLYMLTFSKGKTLSILPETESQWFTADIKKHTQNEILPEW